MKGTERGRQGVWAHILDAEMVTRWMSAWGSQGPFGQAGPACPWRASGEWGGKEGAVWRQ